MSDDGSGRSVWLFEYGEAYDDLQPAFYIDEANYSNAEHARSAVEAASSALRRLGIIFEVELRVEKSDSIGVSPPTWEEFKQRHFVEGDPMPVRPRPKRPAVPPSWDAMNAELNRAHTELRSELVQAMTNAFPGRSVYLTADHGPLRRSPASVDWSEEKFGFEVAIGAATGDFGTGEAMTAIAQQLAAAGWKLGKIQGSDTLTTSGDRAQFTVWIQAKAGSAEVSAYSPLYRAPSDRGADWVSEPRPVPPEHSG